MKHLVIAVMDGAFGFIRDFKRRTRTYMSTVVFSVVDEMFDEGRDFDYSFFHEKGGFWNGPDRRIAKAINYSSGTDRSLLMVGKSYGTRDIVRIARELEVGKKFDTCYLLTVDGDWAFRGDNILYVPNDFDRVINIYQKRVRIGGALAKYEMGIHGGILMNYDITDPHIDHFNIVESPLVRCEIKSMINALIK